ncbi:hypothetical protein [Vibrio viridaestus]|uniref:DUF2570 domain-containing protein n=1 Tax=Vibrio viridaestus TaxID=2487322 RepID=A0A3N9THC6_9VIBR|nr:hypothetical protein [Vibrio viridaestus]RQW63440.1 hypothetical protein EES38_09335 [Vibrio viridaestus]
MTKYIIIGLVVIVISIIGSILYRLETLATKNEYLNQQIKNEQVQNMVKENVISKLSKEKEYMNDLFSQREIKARDLEVGLNEQIDSLKKQLEDINCNIPQSVTEQLQSNY